MAHGLPPLPPRPGGAARPTSPEIASDAVALQVDHSLPPPTYVVVAPKDQTLRVPPPENARLVERYRNALEKRQRRRTPAACCSCLAKALAGVLLVCLAAVLVFYLVVRPKGPSFSVRDVASMDGGGSRERPGLDVTLSVENPSAKLGYFFEKGGKASLSSYNGEKIASGEPPSFNVGYGNGGSEDFKLLLRGSKLELPEKMEKSTSKGSKDVDVSLELSVDLLVRPTVGGMKWWLEHVNLVCYVRVSSLAKGTDIVSQKCETKSFDDKAQGRE